MKTRFEKAFEDVVGIEGGYSDNPNDKGGKTKYGITEAVARAFGYKGHMRDLPLPVAKEIYQKKFWSPFFDELKSELLAFHLFDATVNHGYGNMSKILQRAINALHPGDPLKVDGFAGKVTFDLAKKTNQERVFYLFNAYRAKFYLDLIEKRPSDEEFVFGWLKNRVTFIFEEN